MRILGIPNSMMHGACRLFEDAKLGRGLNGTGAVGECE
jgi:hypothetical protein